MNNKLPLEQLALIGLTPDKLNNMPEDVLEQLANGELTPAINVVQIRDGKYIQIPMKLQVETDERTGQSVLMAYPMSRQFQNTLELSPRDFSRLYAGDVILVNDKYMQRDPETNAVLQVDKDKVELDKRLNDIESVMNVQLGQEQRERAREGKPVELHLENETVTVGLDLREPQHFRSLNGGMDDWQKQKEVDYDIAHPEFVGIVQTDENRWEKMMVEKEGYSSQTLKDRPAQSRNSGLKR